MKKSLALFLTLTFACFTTAYTGSGGDSSTTADISITPGALVKTGGWADMANNGNGIKYPDTQNIIYIGENAYKVGNGQMTAYTNKLTKRMAFTNAIASGSVNNDTVTSTAAIIILAGTVDLSDGKVSDTDHSYFDAFDSTTHKKLHKDIEYKIGSNKAIIGVNSAKIAFGGLTINGYKNHVSKNIIIRNIEFWDSHGSTAYDTKAKGTFEYKGKTYPYNDKNNKVGSNNLGIGYGESKAGTAAPPENIWVDHCKFSDGICEDLLRNFNHDGALDIPVGKNITVSYCEFTNHDKVGLVGNNFSLTNPDVRLVTFHHNYYHKVIQRNPLLRASKSHVYNNYYNEIGVSGSKGYAVGICQAVNLILENNYFGQFQKNIFDIYGESAPSFAPKVYSAGNNKEPASNNCRRRNNAKDISAYLVSTKPWTPGYAYTLDSASDLPNLIPLAAGSDKENYCKIVEVNGVCMNSVDETTQTSQKKRMRKTRSKK